MVPLEGVLPVQISKAFMAWWTSMHSPFAVDAPALLAASSSGVMGGL
jgi:hypothetical protein